MKRFHSNLTKVHDICEQQSRMAELELARAKSIWMAAQQRVEQAISTLEQVRTDVNRALLHSRQPTVVFGLYQHVAAAGEHVEKMQAECVKAEQLCEQARVKYQTIHSKVERIEHLIEKQREVHRRDMLLEQQKAMDDVAIFRWTPSQNPEIEVIHHG